jgi:hypothetical protein
MIETSDEFTYTDTQIILRLKSGNVTFPYMIPRVKNIIELRSLKCELELWRYLLLRMIEFQDRDFLEEITYDNKRGYVKSFGTITLLFARDDHFHIYNSNGIGYPVDRIFYSQVSSWLKDIEVRVTSNFVKK